MFVVIIGCIYCCCFEAASLSLASFAERKEYAPVVQIESGKVRGIIQTTAESAKRVYLYQGIKYGKQVIMMLYYLMITYNLTRRSQTFLQTDACTFLEWCLQCHHSSICLSTTWDRT